MEKRYVCIGNITDTESSEIEYIAERLAGLKELLLICEDDAVAGKIRQEITELESSRASWWHKVSARYEWNPRLATQWIADYQENKVWIDTITADAEV